MQCQLFHKLWFTVSHTSLFLHMHTLILMHLGFNLFIVHYILTQYISMYNKDCSGGKFQFMA
jgi:hypothetical protein